MTRFECTICSNVDPCVLTFDCGVWAEEDWPTQCPIDGEAEWKQVEEA